MIVRESVIVMTPSHHGEVVTGFCSGLIQCADLYGGHAFITGMSEINLARNLMINAFLNLPEQFEWLVSIDADIEFSRQDMLYLLEDHSFIGNESDIDAGDNLRTHAIITAEYARRPIDPTRVGSLPPAKMALGFARVHRSVFERLRDVVNSDGQPIVNAFFHKGEQLHDYFPTGAQGSGHWLSEDHGFFTLCKLANIVPRVETRTRLIHWGRFGARYESGEIVSPI